MGEKIIDKEAIKEIMLDSPHLRLGLCRNGMPYIVPMAFGYRDGAIYLHSSKKGMKMDILRENRNVCFEVDRYYGTVPSEKPCSYNMKYRSVVGFGKATILEDEDEIREGLRVIIDRFHNEKYDIEGLNTAGLAVIRIDIEEMTGRQN